MHRVGLFSFFLFFSLLVGAGRVAAADLQWEIVNRVVSGQGAPSITLRSARALRAASLHLNRNDGKTRQLQFGSISAGGKRTVTFHPGDGRWEYEGTLRLARADGEVVEHPVTFDVVVAPPLKLEVPQDRMRLKSGRLEVRLSRPGARCVAGVYPEEGAPIQVEEVFEGSSEGEWLTVSWPAASSLILKIGLECWDVDGFSNGLELFPWQLEVPHEDVIFSSGSFKVEPKERPKVSAAVEQIQRTVRRYGSVLDLKLYVSGHTDTVGEAETNRTLSERRAGAIARALRRAGVSIPVHYFGYGESRLAIVTEDNVPEAKNRRTRYILAVEPPEGIFWRPLK